MKYEDYIAIETPLTYKYQNILLPELVVILRDYLFEHPDKFNIYVNDIVNVEDLIRHIASNKELQSKEEIETKDILDIVIQYVEG